MKSINIMDSSSIGVFATCTDDICLVPCGCRSEIIEAIKNELKVNTVSCLISDSTLIGSLCKGNENGFIVPNSAISKKIEKITGKKTVNLPGKINAVGNIMLLNDTACLVHPEISEKAVQTIKKILKVDVLRGTIGKNKTVGMSGYATNNGIIVNSKISNEEFEKIESLFQMKPILCTVNLGSYMVGSAVLANKNGCLVGNDTTGYELGNIIKGLGFI